MDSVRARLALFAQSGLAWSALLTAFLLPAMFYLRTYDSAMIKITLAQTGALSALLFWLVKTVETGRLEWPLPAQKILLPALLLLAWTFLAYALSPFRTAALFGFTKMASFLLLFCIGCAELGSLQFAKRLADWTLAAAWVVTLYGAVQWIDYRFFPDMKGPGLDPFIWRKAFGPRVFSTLANPDLLAAFLAGVFPLALASFLSYIPPGPAEGNASGPAVAPAAGGLRSLLAFLLLPLIAFNLICSWSVKGLLAFIPTGLFFMFLAGRFLKGRARRLSLAAAALLLFAIGFCFLINPHRLRERAAYDTAFLARTWAGTFSLIAGHPWLGTGPGSFSAVYPGFRKPEIIRLEGRHNTRTDHPENELLEIWSELGLAGLALALWLFGSVFRAAAGRIRLSAREGREDDTLWLIGLFSSVTGFFFTGLTDALGTRFVAPGTLFWLLAGVLGGAAATHLERGMKFSVLPFPVSIRLSRILYLPAFAVIGLLGYGSVQWFVSDVELNMAVFFSKQSRWEEALSRYDRIMPGSPSYVMAQYFMGNVFQDRGGKEDLEKAVGQYRKVKRLAPHYVQVDHQLGAAYYRLARWDEAAGSFLAAEKLDPLYEPNYRRLAWTYLNKGEKGLALEVYGRFLKWFPDKKTGFEGFIKEGASL